MKLASFILFLLLACSNPIETIIEVEKIVIEQVIVSDEYWISPLGGIIPVTPEWQEGLPVLRGTIVNVFEDTLYNRKMRFIITVKDRPDFILSDTFGYMTLDDTEFKYFPEYPYTIERDLAPWVEYNIYAVGDTLDLDISNRWYYSLIEDD